MASKKDLESVENRLNQKIDNLEIKLTQRMDEGFEAVMEGMDAIAEQLTEKEKFDRLLAWAR